MEDGIIDMSIRSLLSIIPLDLTKFPMISMHYRQVPRFYFPTSYFCDFSARLRKPQDGLFTGVVDALDTVTNTYRITFDRPGIGTHSIPDYEVLVRTDVAAYHCKIQ